MIKLDIYKQIKTPAYIVDESLLIANLKVLQSIQQKTDCKILLAQKAFSMFSMYPLIGQFISGTTASGLYEAILGKEEMNKENHVFCPAYTLEDFEQIVQIADHIVFNSFNQWDKFKLLAKNKASCGIRINPEFSTQEHDIYNPCAQGSRLGVTLDNFQGKNLDGIEGLHFHTLCEQNSDALAKTLEVVEEKFGKYMHQMKWINFGGGHHITREDYDIQTLIDCIVHIKSKYGVQVYLEPGEAVVLNSGFLVTQVLDIIDNGVKAVILDTSGACHMPDVLEMPYRPPILESGLPSELKYNYRLGGPTCLAGDIIGDYSFDKELKEGDKLVFGDMALYSMVKNNTFNGMPLPKIAICTANNELKIIKEFNYLDFKNRLS